MPKFVFETTGGPWTKNGLKGKIVERGFGTEATSEAAFATAHGITPAVLTQAECIALGQQHVASHGYGPDEKIICLNKLLKMKEAGDPQNHPKMLAVYTWMETVQAMAVAGQSLFPPAPHSFEEVIAEQ